MHAASSAPASQQGRTEGEGQTQGRSPELQGTTFKMISGAGGQQVVSEHPSLFLSETISRIHKQQYFISPRLLVGTPISEYKRAVLRFWIYEESAKLGMERNTVAAANTLVDLFLEKGGEVSVEEFQILGIAALILANKCGSREQEVPTNENVFPRRLLNEFEEKLCRKLNFRLAPITYAQVLDELICAWNNFAERHSDLWSYKISTKGRVFSSRSMYELLDTLFMVTSTYTYDLFELVLGVLRMFLRRDHELLSSRPKPIEDEVIISFWNNPEDEPLMASSFETIFQHFLNFLQAGDSGNQEMSLQLTSNAEISYYIHSFLQAGFESTITRDIISQMEDEKQTFNPVGLQVARKFITIKKNQRKSSGETLAI